MEILDPSGNSVKNLIDQHAHVANAFTFKKEEVILEQAGIYKIRATTTDLGAEGANVRDNMVEHTITVE